MSDGEVHVGGQRLLYSEFGSGNRVVVLSHSLFTSRRFQENWAKALAERGFRVITVNMLGDTVDGLPLPIDSYNSEALGVQLIEVLDKLGLDRVVLAGTAFGANISLEAAAAAPERVVGLVLEAPFLEDGISAFGYVSSLLLALFSAGQPVLWFAHQAAKLIPEDRSSMLGLVRDVFSVPSDRARALLHGLALGRMAPPRQLRGALTIPALIVAPRRDPFHPASDAQRLYSELLEAQLLGIKSLLTLRMRPKRATPAIISFLNEVFPHVAMAE